MTPEQCKFAIRQEYEALKRKRVRGLDLIIESRCREAARHNGIPEFWQEYLPYAAPGEQEWK